MIFDKLLPFAYIIYISRASIKFEKPKRTKAFSFFVLSKSYFENIKILNVQILIVVNFFYFY